ncbi:MAG: SDR family oxidoreductase [Chloroflexi bacterium]|nr:SDR family oxidoreductase [Chloroflexota bacterium]
MNAHPLLFSTGNLTQKTLAGQVAVITGAGGGIGLETARSVAWLGARVAIAEIDPHTGEAAAERINAEILPGTCLFVHTDVGDAHSVDELKQRVLSEWGRVDIVLNNATLAPLGGISERPIRDWDASYRVNLRGPVLLAQAFLPEMIERNSGVFACVSSVGGAYMGAYETLKAAQVELARTLDGELEGTNVTVFTIGPGIVPTATARAGVAQIAGRYGKTVEGFFEMYKDQLMSVEEAGAGFAAALALAPRFRGMEIFARQALIAAGIDIVDVTSPVSPQQIDSAQAGEALALCREVRATLSKEYEGWKKRSLFERQWMLRDFKQHAGQPVDQALEALDQLATELDGCSRGEAAAIEKHRSIAGRVAGYYRHYLALAESSMKDPVKLKEYQGIIRGWQEAAERLEIFLKPG